MTGWCESTQSTADRESRRGAERSLVWYGMVWYGIVPSEQNAEWISHPHVSRTRADTQLCVHFVWYLIQNRCKSD